MNTKRNNGITQYFKTYKLNDNSILNVKFIHSPGKEALRGLTESYYSRADGIILVYDITNRNSFDECKNYFCIKIKEKCKKKY